MTLPIICNNCGARCEALKHIGRFNRRHPALCVANYQKHSREQAEEVAKRSFNEQLSAGTRSVVSDSELIIRDGEFKSK